MLIFDFLPNWKRGVVENLEYLTDIMRANDQTEQRAALRSKPRHNMNVSLLLHGADASRFDWLMGAGQAQIMLLPYWPMPFHLTADVENGARSLRIDAGLPAWVVPGSRLVLLSGARDSVAVTVDQHLGGTVTLAAPGVPGKWSKGSLVYPAWEVRAPDSISVKRHTPTVTEMSLTLVREGTGDKVAAPDYGPEMVYNNTEVLVRDINWRDGAEGRLEWLTKDLDGQRGLRAYEVVSALQQRTTSGTVLVRGRAQYDWWLAFLDRHKGRRGVFYAPSRSRDLPLVASPKPQVSPFAVGGTTFHALMQPGTTMMTHIMIRLQDGQYRLHRITGLTVDHVNQVTYISTAEPWGLPYPPEKALCGYLASKCRLGSDTMTINWRAALLGETQISTTTVGANW